MSTKYDAIYFINRDSSPHRLAKISKELKKAGLTGTRFQAIEGRDMELTNLESGEVISGKYMLENKIKTAKNVSYKINCTPNKTDSTEFKFNSFSPLSPNELGLWCSNAALWAQIDTQGLNNAVIFEDDIYINSPKKFELQLNNFISNLPITYDLAFISMIKWGGISKVNPFVLQFTPNSLGHGTYAMLYSAKGIKKLLAAEHYEYPIDLFFLRYDKNNLSNYQESQHFKDPDLSLEIYIAGAGPFVEVNTTSEMERY